MSKKYEVIRYLTVHYGDHNKEYSMRRIEKLNRKSLRKLIEYCKKRGNEYMINRNQIVILIHEYC